MLFASTILVLWAVAYVPSALARRDVAAITISSVVMFGTYAYLAWDERPFPINLLGSVAVFSIALAGGFWQHSVNERKRRENERS